MMTNVDDASARVKMTGIQSLIAREAGYSVAAECLRIQAEAEVADPSLRSSDQIQLHPDAWPWYQGALGEIHVGQLLCALGPQWRVLHSVPIGAKDTDVDHILVGPHGVFVLNTKHHAGASIWVGDHTMMINQAKKPHLQIAQGENHKVAQRLKAKVGFAVTVRSAIVTVGERSTKDVRQPDNRQVAVVSSKHLVHWLTTQPATFSPTQLELLRLAAEEPDTWHVDPHRANSLRVMQRFSRLQEAVGQDPARPAAATAAADRVDTVRSTAPAKSRQRSGGTERKAGTQPPRTRKRTKRETKKLADAILGLSILTAMLIMVSTGTWTGFITGLMAFLLPTVP